MLLSPEIGVSKAAGLAVWQGRIGHWLGLEKLAWNSISVEYDPFKYNSFAVNAGDQAYRITVEIEERMSEKAEAKALGHFFGKVGASIERGANKVANNRKSEDKPSAGESAGKVGNAAMNIAGFDKARLETARELGIDPYTGTFSQTASAGFTGAGWKLTPFGIR
ncbi:MAG: hypothetical protein OSA84_02010 [Akkermansiaceae bacterium]|nr:hypothetical protein [Akkermansiaceae bacterium]